MGNTGDRENDDAVLKGLRTLSGSLRPLEAPPRVEQALLGAYRRNEAVQRRTRLWWQVIAATATVAVVTLAVLTMLPRPVEPDVEMPIAAREVVTDYMPVSFARALDPDEFAHVVRISLHRSELLQFGLPMAAVPEGTRVRADVVLGEDGIARAIRFVQ